MVKREWEIVGLECILEKKRMSIVHDHFVVVFDFETGGFSYNNGILSACFLHPPEYDGDTRAFEVYSLIKPPPQCVIEPKALEINGIKVQDLPHQPTFEEFMIQRVLPCLPKGRSILFVGHNAFDFDARWLRHYLEQVYPAVLTHVPDYAHQWFFSDSLDMAKVYNQTPSKKLVDIFAHFFPDEHFDAHCALDDTRACGRVFECLKEKVSQIPIKCWASIGCMMIIDETNVDRLVYS
jgi:DNA polymerase III epsilon subunit-like protein